MSRGKDLLMVVLPRVGLRFNKSLGSKIGFLINFLPSSLSLGIIGCLTTSLIRDTKSPNKKSTCAECGKGHIG